MKNYFGALLIFLITTSGIFAQVNFEKGHFVTENGIKTDCYIKNEGWQNNPSKFEYKLTLDGDTKVLRMTNLKTLVINDAFKFEKHTVQIDLSEQTIGRLSYARNPEYKEETLMLNVLQEGKASLYSYVDEEKRAFYYKKDSDTLTPLVYKIYTNENRSILYNKRYQQQLLTEFPCETISEKTVVRVDYNAGDLSSFFRKYNECNGAITTEYKKNNNAIFHLKAMAGMYNSYATSIIGTSGSNRSIESEADWSPTFGAEFEYVFPFNRNKWSLFIAANYSSHKGEAKINDLFIERVFSVEYAAIQFPVGFRHTMFLDDNSKIFLNGAAVFDIPFTQKNSGFLSFDDELFKTTVGVAFGVGYSYEKYSIEVRYIPNRELVEKSLVSSVKLTQFGIILGYTIF